ncbi:cellobiose dehydrogenase [Podospora australis]|uniref:Cellobiose dehydrogenase n=1 Tax=Podospora australis TaxID=1536484 RepID=A0AAN7AH55_9PEZI|nr:cellobiose dehydrogenase [Podospora australis]
MGLKSFSLLALGLTVSAESAKRQSTTAKYCPGNTAICFSEFKVPTHDVIYRIAIPDVSEAPFDVLLQIVAPISKAGWAGLAWGGKMNNNPLTVGWPNGNSAVVSSRWSTGRTVPGAYAGATYTVLPTTTTNATHWQLDVLCRGCSQWTGGALNPNGVNNLAWAKNTANVNSVSSNTSAFGIHDGRGVFSHDLSVAKIPRGVFDAVAYDLENPPASVSTSVVLLPRPSSTAAAASSASSVPRPVSSVASAIPTRLTALPSSSAAGQQTSFVYVSTRVTQLPPRPSTRPSTPGIVTVTVTARPTATPTPTQVTPPWGGGGGGPPWGKGKGGGGGWGGKGKGKNWGRRDRLAAEPLEN